MFSIIKLQQMMYVKLCPSSCKAVCGSTRDAADNPFSLSHRNGFQPNLCRIVCSSSAQLMVMECPKQLLCSHVNVHPIWNGLHLVLTCMCVRLRMMGNQKTSGRGAGKVSRGCTAQQPFRGGICMSMYASVQGYNNKKTECQNGHS